MSGVEEPNKLIGALGLGEDAWSTVRLDDAPLASAYEELVRVPRERGPFSPEVCELIGLAASCACSGIDRDAIRAHARAALELGATAEQLREVVQIVSTMGIHSVTMGTPLVMDELTAAGLEPPDATTAEVTAVRDDFIARRGYWTPLFEAIASFDHQFLRAYMEYSSIPAEQGTLSPKVRELVFIAVNSITTHLFPDGLRVHVKNALSQGVTPNEIVAVFELVSSIGFRSALAALPIIADEVAIVEAGR